MKIHSIGIDLGKTTFHLVALGEHGKILLKKKLSRKQLLALTANLPASLIGLEACSGAHFLARALREQGNDARLIPAQFVKPFLSPSHNQSGPVSAMGIFHQLSTFLKVSPAPFIDLRPQPPYDWPL